MWSQPFSLTFSESKTVQWCFTAFQIQKQLTNLSRYLCISQIPNPVSPNYLSSWQCVLLWRTIKPQHIKSFITENWEIKPIQVATQKYSLKYSWRINQMVGREAPSMFPFLNPLLWRLPPVPNIVSTDFIQWTVCCLQYSSAIWFCWLCSKIFLLPTFIVKNTDNASIVYQSMYDRIIAHC